MGFYISRRHVNVQVLSGSVVEARSGLDLRIFI